MKTILITAYAINPYKGSENGMGWNFIKEVAKYYRVIAITRKNNIPHITRYLEEFSIPHMEAVAFYGYDLPKWQRFWKRGNIGAMPYYYLWQRCVPGFIQQKNWEFDLVHNLNFHNDWTPSFLWKLDKPLVWGPIGHHPKIPRSYLLQAGGTLALVKDRLRWIIKQAFWRLSPNLKRTARKASFTFCMNSQAGALLAIDPNRKRILPSVGTEWIEWEPQAPRQTFTIISAGRFVPLKGFEITIRAFAAFYHRQSEEMREKLRLVLVGKGPDLLTMEILIQKLQVEQAVEIIAWIERPKLMDLYRTSDVFFFPSHEGAGMVVAEAMALGLPVLCFDNEGPGEFITEESGLSVPYGDFQVSVNAFAQHLHTLFHTPDLQGRLSHGARKRFLDYFLWEEKGKVLRDVYDKILKVKRAEESLKEKESVKYL